MKLKKLTIENFKGIKKFILNADGENICILGNNGTGKTTVADSVAWLLYDQNSIGASFQPKPLNIIGDAAHGICSDVEGVFVLNDNNHEIKLKKSYYEKWTKKRGSAKAEFTGNIIDYFIDDVPVKKKEYVEKISRIAHEHILKLLTNVKHFSEELHWQDRRQILLDICGDISDADIIASNKDLSPIPEILDGKSFEDQKKIITAQKTKLNKELNDLPIRIDEVDKGLPDMTDIEIDIKEIDQKQKDLSIQLASANEAKARIESGGEKAELTKQLRTLETTLLKIENQDSVLKFQKKAKNDKEILRFENVKDIEESNCKKLLSTIKNSIKENIISEEALAELREIWNGINVSVFDENNTICPTCGQDYPEKKAQEIKETFNINKSKRLTDINKKGKKLATEMSKRKKDSEMFEADVATYDISIKELAEKVATLKNDEDIVLPNPQKEKLERDIEKVKADIEGLKAGSSKLLEKAQTDIDIITEHLENVASKKSEIEARQKGLKRIDELKEQQKICASEFEKLEEKIFIMENFIRAKVAFLETKVNDHFKLAKFKLFNVQVNGALSECCEVTYQGVPWNAGLNNGAKINVGTDIINTLSEFYGLTMPVFVDNAESVTKLIDSSSQVIKLIVDKNFKQLIAQREDTNA